MKKKRFDIKKNYIFLFLLLVIAFGQAINNGYIKIFSIGLLVLLFIASDIDLSTIILFSLIPFFNILNYEIGTTSLYYIFIVVYIIKYLINKRFVVDKSKLLLALVILIIRVFSFDFEGLIKWYLLFLVLIITYGEDCFLKNIYKIVYYISFSFIITSILGYYMLLNGTSIYTISVVYETIRFAGLIGDSVFYSQFALIIIAANIILLFHKFDIHNLLAIIILSIFIVLTYSKAGILLLFFSLLFFALYYIKKNSKSKKTIYRSFAVTIILFVSVALFTSMLFKYSDNKIIQNYYVRFSSKDLTTGRQDISKHYLKLLYDNPESLIVSIKSDDLQKPFYPNSKFIYTINRTHNIYIESFCVFGILTSIGFFIWIAVLTAKCFKRDLLFAYPMIILIVTGFVLHGLLEFHYFCLLAISFAFLNPKSNNYLENKYEI